jgi:hypothetical protein
MSIDNVVLCYGFFMSHAWASLGVVLYVGYLTYADFYDNISQKVIEDFKFASIIISVMCALFFVSMMTSETTKFTPYQYYMGISTVCSFFVTLSVLYLFVRNSYNIRCYFGRKRNKI